jgi:hypothetical protein
MRSNVLLWIVQAVVAALFAFAGVMKLVLPLEALAGPVPLPGLFMRFIGVVEVLGALGLIVPGLTRIRPGLTPLAAAGLVIIMIGATVVTVMGGALALAVVPLIVGLLSTAVGYGRWRLAPLSASSGASNGAARPRILETRGGIRILVTVTAAAFSPSSRARLTDRDLDRFPGDTLFHRLARAVCHAGCVPRKELYEAWEMARRVRRLFRGGRVVDLGAGHGLLAHAMLLLDDSSPSALAVDTALPPSSAKVHDALVRVWPRLSGRVALVARRSEDVDLHCTDVVVSSHACGALTDLVLDRAAEARARVGVLPCCHDFAACDAGAIAGWIERPLAIDILRALRLERQGYRVWTQAIPSDISPKHRLLLGAPMADTATHRPR